MKEITFRGRVVKNGQIGGGFGVATANLKLEEIPRLEEGVYLAKVERNGELWHALLHFGSRKTFGLEFSVEVHLLDFTGDLYDQELVVHILQLLRPIKKFQNADALFTQIETDIMIAKKMFLRMEIKQRWEQTTIQEKNELVERAIEMLQRYEPLKTAKRIGIYAPDKRYEINFVQKFCSKNKDREFFFPKIGEQDLTFIKSAYKDLKPGKWGILQPEGQREDPTTFDLFFVPSLGLDHQGHRLGRGGGYYDALLAKYPNMPTISIVPGFAYQNAIPVQDHDQKIDMAVAV